MAARSNGESVQDDSVSGQHAVELATGADLQLGEDLVQVVLERVKT
jgi:hypothetical protein